MALGLTRDSYVQLSSLTSSENETGNDVGVSIDKTKDSLTEPKVGDSTVISLEDDVETEKRRKYVEQTSRSTASTDSNRTPLNDTKSKAKTSYGTYSGFTMDYAEYNYTDPYAPTVLGSAQKGGNKNLFCCLFPWAAKTIRSDDEDMDSLPSAPSAEGSVQDAVETAVPVASAEKGDNGTNVDQSSSRSLTKSGSGDDDENSTGSDLLGDKLTERERSAVLARLRLSQPDTPLMSDPPIPTGKGLLDEIPPAPLEEKPAGRKGILKTGSVGHKKSNSAQVRSTTLGGSKVDPNQRRSLFPVYRKAENKAPDDRNIHFAPMARVVTVKSRKAMNFPEKAAVWWQRSDYDDFKKTGRLVAKAMLQGGSEVWLMTNESWQHPGTKKAILNQTPKGSNGNKGASPDKDLDNKWWHKFGHSRRGLEHIASMEEGKQRQMNVRVAVRAVLDEQRKQRMYGRNDPEKIRSVYHQFSSWARDLAYAAGSSDAEAVTSNFSDSRRSREFYLLKHHVRRGSGGPRHVPDFMKPTDLNLTAPQNLDANTRTQLRMRRKKIAAVNSAAGTAPQSSEAIHDPVPHSGKSIAKQAAGFGTADENVSMAAVLSGMGTVSANPARTSVGAH